MNNYSEMERLLAASGTGVTGGVKANTLAKIDQRSRQINSSLSRTLPLKLLPWVISFAVSRINLDSFSNGGQASPRELFCGRKVDFNRDVRVAFGDYCEILHRCKDPKATLTSLLKSEHLKLTKACIPSQ
jgi:hypothetical protein